MIQHPIAGPIGNPVPHPLAVDSLGDPWVFDYDANALSRHVMVGSGIDSYTDRGITLGHNGVRHVRNTVTTLGGFPVAALTQTGAPRLFTALGPTVGTQDHAIICVQRHRATLIAPVRGTMAMFGKINAGTRGASTVGEVTAGSWHGGGTNVDFPTVPIIAGDHVVAKTCVNGKVWVIGGGTPQIDPSSLVVDPSAIPFNVLRGIGIGEFIDNFSGAPETDLARALFAIRTITLRQLQAYVRAFSLFYGIGNRLPRVEWFGDSITWGTGTTTPGGALAPPGILKSELISGGLTGAVVNNHGNPGWTTGMMLNDVNPGSGVRELNRQVLDHFSEMYRTTGTGLPGHFAIFTGGTNDIKSGVDLPPETAITNLRAMAALIRAQGFRPIFITLPPYTASGSSPPGSPLDLKRQIINDYWRTTGLSLGEIDAIIDLESPFNVATYGDLSQDAFHAAPGDDTHPGDLGSEKMGLEARDVLLPLMTA